MAQDIPITPEGLAGVRKELEELIRVRRPEISDKIRSARELGDLSENFEYHAARNEQGFIELRIAELEAIVRNAVLIEAPAASDKVQVGSTVRFQEEDGPEETYRIVGPAEADPASGKISNESAVGRALIGRRVGDEVKVDTLDGSYTLHVKGIE
jgi:transcription elongation factor GreA